MLKKIMCCFMCCIMIFCNVLNVKAVTSTEKFDFSAKASALYKDYSQLLMGRSVITKVNENLYDKIWNEKQEGINSEFEMKDIKNFQGRSKSLYAF